MTWTDCGKFHAARNWATLPLTAKAMDSPGAMLVPTGMVTAAGSLGLLESSSHL